MTWQGVSEAECYDNRSVMAQIMRLKDRVRALEESGIEDIEQEIEQINGELTILEGKVGALEEGTASLAEDVAALETSKADANAVVKLTGNQTIMDVKSFIRSPIVPTPTANSEAATKKYVDDKSHEYTAGLGMSINNDIIGIEQSYADNIVKKDSSNQQTISSSIYFTTIPRAPGTPVNASDLANKSYVDSVAGGGGGGGTYTAGTGLQLVGTEFSLDSATQTAVSAVSGKADDNAVMKLTGAQSVAGVKTFSDSPIVPTPTMDYQAATKKYVDDNAGGGSSGTWATLAVSEYTSTRLSELLPSDATGIRTAAAEIAVYYRYNISSGASRNGFMIIPKGAKLLDTATITDCNPSGAATYLATISISLKDVFTTTNPTATISKFSGSTITRTAVTAAVNISDIPYYASPTTTDNVNICIQYR